MKADNIVKITFKSKSINEGFARGAVSALVASLDPTVEQLADIKIAVSEAVTNAIVHAYPDRLGDITLRIAVYGSERLTITIADKGVGIENIIKAREPLFTTGGDERAGLGFAVMESFMDKVTVYSKPNKGTRVTLTKYINN